MKLNELRDKIHENAKRKGFYDNVTEGFVIHKKILGHAFFAQQIALIHSELSEALESDRNDKYFETEKYESLFTDWVGYVESENDKFNRVFEDCVKNTVQDELADVIIRVLDLCGYMEIDIEKHIEIKMKYNESREYKHGKNY